MPSKSELYEAGFAHLRAAQAVEEANPADAIRQYQLAFAAFSQALALEQDPQKVTYVQEQLREYGLRLRRLQELARSDERQDDMLFNEFDEPPTAACPRIARSVSSGPTSSADRQRTLSHPVVPLARTVSTPHVTSATAAAATAAQRAPLLSEREVQALAESSIISGKVFQPWLDGEETKEQFTYKAPWTDPDGQPPLSQKQIARTARWRRPHEFLPESQRPVMVGDLDPLAITQDLVTDCSFVASLCIGAALEKRSGNRIITGNIFPQQNGRPVYNPSGKYMVRLWFNGIARKVIVDDYLPVDDRNRLLCSSAAGGRELWVSIMEKAYMKLHGGYNFPGSNSGIDLFALSGWIPEQLFFAEDALSPMRGLSTASNRLDHRQPEERAWERLLGAHQSCDCLITISTGGHGSPESQQATSMGLIRGHAYAVLDVRVAQSKGQLLRMVKVKNPWGRLRWEGRFSAADTASWTPELRRQLHYIPEQAIHDDNGVFWMEFSDIRRFFRSFNVNWNPQIFRYRRAMHDKWSSTEGLLNDRYILGYNPQYSIRVPSSGRPGERPVLWVLVSRHTTQVETETEGAFLAVLTYKDTGGGRVYNHPRPYINDVYSNDPHHLVRIDVDFAQADGASEGESLISREATYTIVLSQNTENQGLELLDVNYTINVYSSSNFEFYATPPPPQVRVQFQSNWSPSCPGGNPNNQTYSTNPMWHLRLTERTRCHFELRVPREIAVQVAIVGGELGGRRIERLSRRNLVCDSQAYVVAFAYLDADLAPGDYTIVASRYEPGPAGTCMLLVCTDLASATVVELPQAV